MPVGIELRMSEFCGDAFLKTFGDEMFKPLGLLVDFFDRVIENVYKETFRLTDDGAALQEHGAFLAERVERRDAFRIPRKTAESKRAFAACW